MKPVPAKHLALSFPCSPWPPTLWQRNALQNHGSVLLVNVLRDTKQPFVPTLRANTIERTQYNGSKDILQRTIMSMNKQISTLPFKKGK